MVIKTEDGWKGDKGQFFGTAEEAFKSFKEDVSIAIDKIEIIPDDAKKAIKDKLRDMIDNGVETAIELIDKVPSELVNFYTDYHEVIIEALKNLIA